MHRAPADSAPSQYAQHPDSGPRGWEWVVDTLLCFFSCSLGAASGLVAGTLLGLGTGFSAALAVALAPASCLFLTECPVARRLGLVLKQYG